MQEAAIRAIRAAEGWRGEGQLSTWVTRIVINRALMHLRGKRAKLGGDERGMPLEEIEYMPGLGKTPEQLAIEKERAGVLMEEVGKLTEKRRDAILGWLRGDTVSDTDAALKARRFCAKRALRRALEARGIC
jgi:RNA polymerase sigma-70 factor, ECF subfamily